jgi:hypothetical protein
MSKKATPATGAAHQPPVVRSLGKMERSLWFCDQCSPTNIGLGCEIQGQFTDDALRQALRWCQIRHPMLRSVIRAEGKTLQLACFDINGAPEIPLEIRPGTVADEDSAVMAAMRQPLAATGGLMARAILLRLDERRASLAIVFSHVIGDGFSAVLLLQDIVNFLGRYMRDGAVPDPAPLPFPPPSEQGIAAEHRGWSGFRKLMAVQKEIAADLKRHGAKPSPVRVQTEPPLTAREIQCSNFALTADQTRAFVARAKQEQVSTFALLAASLLDALRPLLEPARKNAGSERVVSFAAPVDMRPFLSHPVKEQFGFYSSAINQLQLLLETNDIPALAKALHGGLKKSFLQQKVHLHTTPLLADFLAWRWLFPLNGRGVARVAKMTRGMFKSCATSLTFLNDSIRIEENHGITMARPRGHISPSIMGVGLYCALLYKDVLTVHLNYNEGQLADADAEQLNARFKRNLIEVGRSGGVPPANVDSAETSAAEEVDAMARHR